MNVAAGIFNTNHHNDSPDRHHLYMFFSSPVQQLNGGCGGDGGRLCDQYNTFWHRQEL